MSDILAEYVDGCDSTTRRELHSASAISPDVTRERGYETITRPSNADRRNVERLQALNIPGWALNEDRYFPGILIPIWGTTGRVVSHQWKPRVAVANREGKKMKYASAKGQASRLDVHPRWTTLSDEIVPPLRDATLPLLITEGIKKGDSLTTNVGWPTVALNGVYNWRSSTGTLGDWEDVALKGRRVGIVFDADAISNRNVRMAGNRLKKWLKSKGAKEIRFFIPPATLNGQETKGVDDYFAAGATRDDFLKLAARTMPEQATDETGYTDAKMAEKYVEGCLGGTFLYVPGTELGWRRWTGRRWEDVDTAVPLNVMREHAIDQHAEALRWKAECIEQREDATDASCAVEGWAAAQSKSKLTAALSLAEGIPDIRQEANAFDQHPDLLNTPDGVLTLRESRLEPHDPDLLFTRITEAGFNPGAKADAFTAVLKSVSPEALDWLQIQFGQGITGHHSESLVMLTGGGRNGKSKLMDVVTGALGSNLPDAAGYAQLVPNTLLLATTDKGGATPEKMTLLGLRFAYMEETPEDGHLNANMLKEVVDAPAISGRFLYRNTVTWRPSHNLFLNTNHPPQVGGTDTAIWRRLKRVDFPYRFRLEGDGLGAILDTDLEGMPHMGQALDTDEARAAALAWMVEGARRWYELKDAGEDPPIPASVHASVQKWRVETDDVLNFYLEHLEPDPTSWVWTSSLYAVFSDWVKDRGGKPMGQKTLTGRLVGHTALPGIITAPRKRRGQPGHSPYPYAAGFMAEQHEPKADQAQAYAGVRWKAKESAF